MAKPKYYLKPFWMVAKQYPYDYHKKSKLFYGLSKETWNFILKENKTPSQVNQFEYVISHNQNLNYFRPEYLTKRLSMEIKNIKRG